jgi:hypothetical protein
MNPAAAMSEEPASPGDYALVARSAELCNPFLDALDEITLTIRGPVNVAILRWNAALFAPHLQPALLETVSLASGGASFEITALDCRLDATLPGDARLQSRDAGKRLIGGLLAPKGDRLIERYRASVLAGDSPGHLAVIHALRASLFHLPPRVMLASYLLQEGVGAGLDGREIARFLIGSLIGTQGTLPSNGLFVAES